ncbi:hypothetical protein M5D96_013940, partial [Drosophila gunungcola]
MFKFTINTCFSKTNDLPRVLKYQFTASHAAAVHVCIHTYKRESMRA